MEEIELHISINADVVIPEWLRRKMGLTNDSAYKTDRQEKRTAKKQALDGLADALRDAGIADISFVDVGNVHRSEDRG